MRKMNKNDVALVVQLLKRWQRSRVSWQLLRSQISMTMLNGDVAWSRQSLQANKTIYAEWLATRKRLSAQPYRSGSSGLGGVQGADATADTSEVEALRARLDQLQAKYDNLAIQHRQLVYNVSMIQGGARLLLDPLPDNTPVQKAGAQARRKS